MPPRPDGHATPDPADEASTRRGPRWTSIAFPLIAFATCLVAFWPSIPGGRFLNWDDDKNILENYDFRGLSPKHLHWMWTTGKMGHYQPLSWTSLGLDYVLWGMTGPDFPEAARFRLTNLLLHAVGAAAFYWLALRLLRNATDRVGVGGGATFAAAAEPIPVHEAALRGGALNLPLAALVATLLYAIHPLRCESVCWITERRDVLSGLFFIAALIAYLQANPPRARLHVHGGWLAAAVVAAGLTCVLFVAAIDRDNKFNLRWTRLGAPGFALLLAAAAGSAVAASRALASPDAPRRAAWMLAAYALLVASLFSKAWGMVMPVLFLLLDYWPLGRLAGGIAAAHGAVTPGAASLGASTPGAAAHSAARSGAAARRAAAGGAAAQSAAAGAAAHAAAPSARRKPTNPAAHAARERTGLRAAAVLIAEKAPFLALSIIFAALARWGQEGQLDTLKTLAEHTLSERIAQAFYGLAFYPFKTVWPAALSPIYELPDQLSPFEPRYLLPALAVLAATAALFVWRRRFPGAWVAWLCYGVIVSPVLGIQQSGPQLVAARYAYLSCMPFAILAGGWLLTGTRRREAAAFALYPAALGICAVLGLQTWRLSAEWRDSQRLWTYAARVQPQSAIANMNLGVERKRQAVAEKDAARQAALFDEAIAHYRRAVELDPQNARIYSNLANVYSQMADDLPARRAELLSRAIEASARALELSQQHDLPIPEMRLNHGVILFGAGRTAEALAEFDRFVRIKPQHAVGRNNLGMAQLKLGRAADAIPNLEEAVRIEPSYSNAWRNLGDACRAAGRRERAIEAYRRRLKLTPDDKPSAARLRELGG